MADRRWTGQPVAARAGEARASTDRPPATRTWIDRAIGVFAPGREEKRVAARIRTETMVRAYDGATVGRRTDGWRTHGTSADVEIGAALPRLRQRARDLSRNNPHAKRAKSLWTTYLVGAGIMPRMKNAATARDEQRAVAVMETWEAFVASSDASGSLNFYGQMALAVEIMVEGGESLIRRRLRRPGDGLTVPLQLQVLEGDHLDISKTQDLGNGRVIIQGVEFDALGKPAAYWLFPDHPGNTSLPLRGTLESRPVPASEIIHLYRQDGRTQTRGVPWAHSVITKFRDWDDVEDAEIVRKKAEACIVGVAVGQVADDPEVPIAPKITDMNGELVEQFEPGMWVRAEGSSDVKFNTPGSAGGFTDYRKASLHTIAAGYDLPYMLLAGDLADVNFTSSRVGLNAFYAMVDQLQWLLLVPVLCETVWRWFCEAGYLAGALPSRRIPCEWQPPGIASVNPLDDVAADLKEVRAGFASPQEKISKRGRDPADVMREIAAWNKAVDAAGHVFDSDPRKVAQAGTEQPSLASQESVAPKAKPKRVA